MTDNRQTARKVKGKLGRRKREESTFYKTVLEKASEFCWSSFAVERKTLPWSTRRNMIINKFTFGSPWLPDYPICYVNIDLRHQYGISEAQTFLPANVPGGDWEQEETAVFAG